MQTLARSPQRVQRARRAGQPGMPAGATYVGRGSRWGNMFKVVKLPYPTFARGTYTIRDLGGKTTVSYQGIVVDEFGATFMAVRLYDLHTSPGGRYEWTDADWTAARALAGRDLACWCKLTNPESGDPWPCHADVLLERANGGR